MCSLWPHEKTYYLVLKLKFMFFVQCVLPIVFFALNVSVLLLVVCSFFVVFCLVKMHDFYKPFIQCNMIFMLGGFYPDFDPLLTCIFGFGCFLMRNGL